MASSVLAAPAARYSGTALRSQLSSDRRMASSGSISRTDWTVYESDSSATDSTVGHPNHGTSAPFYSLSDNGPIEVASRHYRVQKKAHGYRLCEPLVYLTSPASKPPRLAGDEAGPPGNPHSIWLHGMSATQFPRIRWLAAVGGWSSSLLSLQRFQGPMPPLDHGIKFGSPPRARDA
jgi:hypothetical protein